MQFEGGRQEVHIDDLKLYEVENFEGEPEKLLYAEFCPEPPKVNTDIQTQTEKLETSDNQVQTGTPMTTVTMDTKAQTETPATENAVENILAHKTNSAGKLEFLVQWKGKKKSEISWLGFANLVKCAKGFVMYCGLNGIKMELTGFDLVPNPTKPQAEV